MRTYGRRFAAQSSGPPPVPLFRPFMSLWHQSMIDEVCDNRSGMTPSFNAICSPNLQGFISQLCLIKHRWRQPQTVAILSFEEDVNSRQFVPFFPLLRSGSRFTFRLFMRQARVPTIFTILLFFTFGGSRVPMHFQQSWESTRCVRLTNASGMPGVGGRSEKAHK